MGIGANLTNEIGEMLRQNKNISDQTWYQILNACRLDFGEYFSSFTLPALGEVACLSGRKRFGERNVNCLLDKDQWLLGLHGLFHLAKTVKDEKEYLKVSIAQDETHAFFGGVHYLWGLSRWASKADWTIVKIGFKPGWVDEVGEYQYAKSIVKWSNPKASDIVKLGISPIQMMAELQEDLESGAKRRLELYEQAQALCTTMGANLDLLRYLPDWKSVSQ
jgi:hypothetical protein